MDHNYGVLNAKRIRGHISKNVFNPIREYWLLMQKKIQIPLSLQTDGVNISYI